MGNIKQSIQQQENVGILATECALVNQNELQRDFATIWGRS